jgi:hypothetical protein
MIDLIVVAAPFTTPFRRLPFLVNMNNVMLFMWLKDLSFSHISMCSIFVAFVNIFTWYFM